MRILITGVLLVATTFLLFSVPAQPPHQPPHLNRSEVAVDGSQRPDLIPDQRVGSLILRFLTRLGDERARVYIDHKGLGNSDVLLRLAHEFEARIRPLDIRVSALKDQFWPDPSDEVLSEISDIQRQKDALVDDIMSRLPDAAFTALGRMKQRTKLSRTPEVRPADWRR